jgi:hypothetical protein
MRKPWGTSFRPFRFREPSYCLNNRMVSKKEKKKPCHRIAGAQVQSKNMPTNRILTLCTMADAVQVFLSALEN